MNHMNASGIDTTVETTAIETVLPPINVLYTACEVIVAIVAVIGNAMTLYVFGVDRKLRRLTNYYIASLALADLLVGIIGIPFAILTAIGLPRSMWFCIPMLSFLMTLCTISIFCLVAVSVDRYWAILYPLVYSRIMTGKIARRIIVFCWLAGTLIGAIPIWWHRNYGDCVFLHIMDYDYLVFLYFSTIIFPGVLMAVFYAHIYSVVIKQGKLLIRSSHGMLRQIEYQKGPRDENFAPKTQTRKGYFRCFGNDRSSIKFGLSSIKENYRYLKRSSTANIKPEKQTQFSDPLVHETDCSCRKSTPHGQRVSTCSMESNCKDSNSTLVLSQLARPSKREVKAAKNLSIIVLFFMFCWFPLYTINCISAFCSNCYVPLELLNFTIILSHANSAVNPILYAYHMKDFRLALQVHILQRLGWIKEKDTTKQYPGSPHCSNVIQHCATPDSLYSRTPVNNPGSPYGWRINQKCNYHHLSPSLSFNAVQHSIGFHKIPNNNMPYNEDRFYNHVSNVNRWPPDLANGIQSDHSNNYKHQTPTVNNKPIKRYLSIPLILLKNSTIMEETDISFIKDCSSEKINAKTQSVPSSPKQGITSKPQDSECATSKDDINVYMNSHHKVSSYHISGINETKTFNFLKRSTSLDSLYSVKNNEMNKIRKTNSCDISFCTSNSHKGCSTFRQNKISKQLIPYL